MSQTVEKSFGLIQAAHQRGRLAHAFIISGAAGSGKEELASRLITMLNHSSDGSTDLFGEKVTPQLIPLDEQESGWVRIIRPKSKSRIIPVDQMRNLEDSLHKIAPKNAVKVGVIVDADRMNEGAENAFLKTLEEPPERTLLLLLTTTPQRLLPTVISRCVQIKLLGGKSLGIHGGDELIKALNQVASNGLSGPINALLMKSTFASFLAAKKTEIEAATKIAIREETAIYKDTTDGKWLKERKAYYEGAIQADYLEARGRFLDILLAWLADINRVKSGATGLEFPESAELFKKIAATETVSSLVNRLDAIEQLRQTLQTNAAEPLALEVGFLKAFS